MAIGWLTLLKAVPWIEVAKKAPEVAESAKKLWNTIAKNPSKPEIQVQEAQQETTLFSSQDEELKWLKDRLKANEVAYADLHKQMLSSAELIKTLADQHTQLVQAVELNRKRLVRLTFIIIIVAIIGMYFIIAKL